MAARTVLVIAGSDPTGGAGLELDLRVLQIHGCRGMPVTTALTVQDRRGVREVNPVDPAVFRRRLDALLERERPDAVKVGMLATEAIARATAERLGALSGSVPVIVDPVIRATRGARLLDDDGIEVLRSEILPRADVVLPNWSEAVRLAGVDPDASAAEIVRALLALRCRVVVLTGGDRDGDTVTDVFARSGEILPLVHERIPGDAPHGTGCALASALAARLTRGDGLLEAVKGARGFLLRSIRRARLVAPDWPFLEFGEDDDD